MFYRQGGSASRINAQFDEIYADYVGAITGWLPVSRGNWVSVNICRASIVFNNPAQSTVTKSVIAPDATILLEQKGGAGGLWPLDQWQNFLVATGRRVNLDGWWRLRILNINNLSGDGLAMAMQINRTGDNGVDV